MDLWNYLRTHSCQGLRIRASGREASFLLVLFMKGDHAFQDVINKSVISAQLQGIKSGWPAQFSYTIISSYFAPRWLSSLQTRGSSELTLQRDLFALWSFQRHRVLICLAGSMFSTCSDQSVHFLAIRHAHITSRHIAGFIARHSIHYSHTDVWLS